MNYRFAAYEALLSLREALNKYPEQNLLNEINALISQVQDRKFIVAVAGEFNRGKSSLINALLGMPILPMDILPMTATANRIIYGLTPRVRIQKKDGSEIQIHIDELADYVTKQTEQSCQMAKTIRETVIEYPTMLCQNGIEILDTPGLNDTEEMTAITRTILQEAHAVVFAVSAVMPLGMSEVDWLAGMMESQKLEYLMFAVTFFDRVAKRDREKVLQNIRTRIATMVQSRVQELYPGRPELLEKARQLTDPQTMFLMPVSSRDALDAFELGDDELLQRSNLPQFKMGITTELNAQQDEYAVRRASELLCQVKAWVEKADRQRDGVKEAQKLSRDCDEALQCLEAYIRDVKQRINQVYGAMEASVGSAPDAYAEMREAAIAVLDAYKGKIQSNADVHSALREATAAARGAARAHYLRQWQAVNFAILSPFMEAVQAEHEKLLGCCRLALGSVPQMKETEKLRKTLWSMMGARILPELPEAWSLDITGGVLMDMVSGGQQIADSIGKTMSNATDFLEKRSPGFRNIRGKLGELMQKTGVAEKVGSIRLPSIEVQEGLLTGRNLSSEINPMLSEAATSLANSWRKMPEAAGPVLHQVYLGEEALLTDTSLQMALTKRKGEAEASAFQLFREYEERFESARICVEKATRALDGSAQTGQGGND